MMDTTPYVRIMEKLDANAFAAPRGLDGKYSQAFIDYLKLLFTPEEA